MPIVFTSSLAAAGNSTTNGTPGTESGTVSLKTASQGRNIGFRRADVMGKAAALTTISGIAFRVCSFTTASTAGTATTPTDKDVTRNSTATAVGATGQTISVTGRKQHAIFGCGAAGPGGWVAQDVDSVVVITPNATAPSVDIVSASGTASLNYEFAVEHTE